MNSHLYTYLIKYTLTNTYYATVHYIKIRQFIPIIYFTSYYIIENHLPTI